MRQNLITIMQLISGRRTSAKNALLFLLRARKKPPKIVLFFWLKIVSCNHNFAVPTLLRVGDTDLLTCISEMTVSRLILKATMQVCGLSLIRDKTATRFICLIALGTVIGKTI